MSSIPKVGDMIFIESDRYTGDAFITYIDHERLYTDHFYPIQCEISEEDLPQFPEWNHGQTMVRFNLKEIVGVQTPENVIVGNTQGDLFDGFDF